MKKVLSASFVIAAIISSSSVLADSFQFRHPVSGVKINAPEPPLETSKVECGQYHCYALVGDTVWAVGKNNNGQLGVGDNDNRSIWVETDLNGVSDISSGSNSGYAIAGGFLYVTGENGQGQLGLGDLTSRNSWVKVEGLSDVVKVSGGQSHAYAIAESDTKLYATGSNGYGQLGRSDVCSSSTYCKSSNWGYANINGVSQIEAGWYHGYALVGDEVYSTGWNRYGELGRSDICYGSDCKAGEWGETGLTGVSKVVSGGSFGYALVGGVLYSVGSNRAGQLGIGSFSDRKNWGNAGLEGVSDIAAGGMHGYAILGGELYSVGFNHYGQLGRSNAGDEPYDGYEDEASWGSTGLNNVVRLTSGGDVGYFKKGDGTFWSVGRSSNGILSRSGYGSDIEQATMPEDLQE